MEGITTLDNGNILVEVTVGAWRRPPLKKKTKDIDNHTSPQEGSLPQGATDTVENEGGDDTTTSTNTVRDRWRLISTDLLYPQMGMFGPQAVDYGHQDGAALKECVALINDNCIPVTWDHSWSVKDIAGSLENASWENSKDIFPGINGYLVVDKEYDSKAAMGIEKGLIRAGSISVSFEMERSHPSMKIETFIEMSGEEVDGEIVRWLPVSARAVNHFALVQQGADFRAGPRTSNTAATEQELTTGENVMNEDNKSLTMLAGICEGLGIEVCLTDESNIPETLQARLSDKVTVLSEAQKSFNDLTERIQSLSAHVAKDDATLSSAEILDRLPSQLEFAKYGQDYLEDIKSDALRWFDTARVDPDKPELSDHCKALRGAIESCDCVTTLKAYIQEYKPQAEAVIGKVDMRSSQGEELPPEKPKTEIEDATAREIRKAAQRIHKR